MEATPAPITFVVRIRPSERGDVTGIVERVRTGEKHRFQGAEALGPLIAAMVQAEAAGSLGGDRGGIRHDPHIEGQ